MSALRAREKEHFRSVHGRARLAAIPHSGRRHFASTSDRFVQSSAQEARRDDEARQTRWTHTQSTAAPHRWYYAQYRSAKTNGSPQVE